jgi:hypothetical protein
VGREVDHFRNRRILLHGVDAFPHSFPG